jgi:DNA processing protein
MQYLTLIRLLQKNIRLIQNYRHLTESFLPFQASFEELHRYLKEAEPFFCQQVLSDRTAFKDEMEGLTRLQKQGVQFTHPGDGAYPASFVQMPGAPILFSFRGHPSWASGPSIAVVGSREATQLSHVWMEDCFAEFLRREKPVVVSGGARGIDQLAHQLALRNHCPTVVALPSGLNNIYPKNLESWQSRIIDGGGCLMSEYEHDEEMRKHFFRDRNRLIAGLGGTTLLVEGRRRSGSLLTAHKTVEIGKNVLVVPGHPGDSSHLGNLDLLHDGATMVRDAEDLCTCFRVELNLPLEASPIASQSYAL